MGFSISGLSGGVDWSAYTSAVRKAEEAALTRTLGKRQIKLTGEQSVLGGVKTLMDKLKASVIGFKFSRDFKTKSVTSSDSDVVTGTAGSGAVLQSASVRVDQLATNEVWDAAHTSVNSSVTTSDQTLTINVRGVSNVLQVTSGTTLSQLAEQINSSDIGVTASVYDVGDGSSESARLVITDNELGKSNSDQTAGVNFNISFTSTLTELTTGDFGVAPVIEGKDSKFYLNGDTGTAIYRDTNTLSDVLPGVSLKLISADNTEFKTLTISESVSDASETITSFVKQYNEAIGTIKNAVRYNPGEAQQSNPTAGNSTLRGILTSLSSSVTGTLRSLPKDNAITSLADLGVTTIYTTASDPQNGMLQFDESKFNEALANNFDDVVKFFEGTTIDGTRYEGFGDKMDDVLGAILSPTRGGLTTKIKSVQVQLTDLDDNIRKALTRLDEKEQAMQTRFARLETLLGQLAGQQSALTSALDSISNNSRYISNR